MNDSTRPGQLDALRAVIDRWITVSGGARSPDEEFEHKLDALHRVVELARLTTGAVVNKYTMREVLAAGVSVDLDAMLVGIGSTPDGSPRVDTSGWPAPNERMPNELQAPLLSYLLRQYKRPRRIHETIEGFVRAVKPFLTPFDTESTVTGVPRVMTNTRVAANLLRDWGLLQNSPRVRYKSWELTHLGLLAAAALAREGRPGIPARTLSMPYGQFVAEPIREVLWRLRRVDLLVPTLRIICADNGDVLRSLDAIHHLVCEYADALMRSVDLYDFSGSRAAALDVLRRIEETIPVESLADDLAVDLALRDLLGT
jgi:hypothetical protein